MTALDVTSPASVERAVKATLEKFGRIDVVVNNAGYGQWGVFEQTPDAKVRELFEVNLFGVMNVTRAVLPHFREHKAGLFVNISSGAGVFGLPVSTVYNASKFALEGYSEALWYELTALGIGVKVVEPGGVLATRFGERAQAEANPPSAIRDYDAFLASATKVFDGLRTRKTRPRNTWRRASSRRRLIRLINSATWRRVHRRASQHF